MNIKRAMDLIDVVAVATFTAGFMIIVGWPALVVGCGLGVLTYTRRRLRYLQQPITDDEMSSLANAAYAISEDGRPIQRLHMSTADSLGVLANLRAAGFDVVRVKLPERCR